MVYHRTENVVNQLAQNRARILEAAHRLISEGGWQEGQVANIAAAAGLATGTVYRYFPSKVELFTEVLEGVSAHEQVVMGEVIDGEGTPAERLHDVVRTFVMRAMRNRRMAYALIAEPCDREIDEARLKSRYAIGQQIVRLLKEGQKRGDFRKDLRADLAAAIIVGGFMEALVGPLSPLAANLKAESAAAEVVANEIAGVCCAAVLAHAPKGGQRR